MCQRRLPRRTPDACIPLLQTLTICYLSLPGFALLLATSQTHLSGQTFETVLCAGFLDVGGGQGAFGLAGQRGTNVWVSKRVAFYTACASTGAGVSLEVEKGGTRKVEVARRAARPVRSVRGTGACPCFSIHQRCQRSLHLRGKLEESDVCFEERA